VTREARRTLRASRISTPDSASSVSGFHPDGEVIVAQLFRETGRLAHGSEQEQAAPTPHSSVTFGSGKAGDLAAEEVSTTGPSASSMSLRGERRRVTASAFQ